VFNARVVVNAVSRWVRYAKNHKQVAKGGVRQAAVGVAVQCRRYGAVRGEKTGRHAASNGGARQ